MATFQDKQLIATRWYGRASPVELFINPEGTEESVTRLATAMYGARLILAAKAGTALFVLVTLFAFAYLGTLGLLALAGLAVFGAMWIGMHFRQKKLLVGIKVGKLAGGDYDDTLGYSRLNVVLDDAVRGEEADEVSEDMRHAISEVLSALPDVFDHVEAEAASVRVQAILSDEQVLNT